MATIDKKLIHFNKRKEFDNRLANGDIKETSIVFIKDTQEIWTHGEFYDGSSPNLNDYVTNEIFNEEIANIKLDQITLDSKIKEGLFKICNDTLPDKPDDSDKNKIFLLRHLDTLEDFNVLSSYKDKSLSTSNINLDPFSNGPTNIDCIEVDGESFYIPHYDWDDTDTYASFVYENGSNNLSITFYSESISVTSNFDCNVKFYQFSEDQFDAYGWANDKWISLSNQADLDIDLSNYVTKDGVIPLYTSTAKNQFPELLDENNNIYLELLPEGVYSNPGNIVDTNGNYSLPEASYANVSVGKTPGGGTLIVTNQPAKYKRFIYFGGDNRVWSAFAKDGAKGTITRDSWKLIGEGDGGGGNAESDVYVLPDVIDISLEDFFGSGVIDGERYNDLLNAVNNGKMVIFKTYIESEGYPRSFIATSSLSFEDNIVFNFSFIPISLPATLVGAIMFTFDGSQASYIVALMDFQLQSYSALTTSSLAIARSNSKSLGIQAGKQYFNEVANRTISSYEGFSPTNTSATILSSSPITFEGDNVLVPSEIPDSDYLLYKIEYMQTSDIKYVLVVSVTAMKTPEGGLKGEDIPQTSDASPILNLLKK